MWISRATYNQMVEDAKKHESVRQSQEREIFKLIEEVRNLSSASAIGLNYYLTEEHPSGSRRMVFEISVQPDQIMMMRSYPGRISALVEYLTPAFAQGLTEILEEETGHTETADWNRKGLFGR